MSSYRIDTKWPRLLVKGQPVTREQTNEILIRTNAYWMTTNDRTWMQTVNEILGIPQQPKHPVSGHGWATWMNERERIWTEDLHRLELSYLANSRIASCWVGGPHGWCDWDGTIGATNYNIGKWPEWDEVTGDWANIAKAFPYLDLTAQLREEEGEGRPCGQWRIKDGTVTEEAPTETFGPIPEFVDAPVVFEYQGERGIDPLRLLEAVGQVRRTVGKEA